MPHENPGDFRRVVRRDDIRTPLKTPAWEAIISSAPRGFAARSRVLARLVSLAQIGELARRLSLTGCGCVRLQEVPTTSA